MARKTYIFEVCCIKDKLKIKYRKENNKKSENNSKIVLLNLKFIKFRKVSLIDNFVIN